MAKAKTEFIRLCPKCGKELYYKHAIGLAEAIERNLNCNSCPLIGIKRSEEHKQRLSKLYKNKSHIETYGKEKAEEMRLKNRNAHLGKSPPNKGKTNIEYFGEEKAKELSKKNSDTHSGENNRVLGKTYIELYGEEKAKEINKKKSKALKGRSCEDLHGKEKADKLKAQNSKSSRLRHIKRIKLIIKNGGQMQPFYNPAGCQYFNLLMEQTGTYIQHAENGGEFHIKELGFWVDGYDAENNIVYEYDENQHFNTDGTYIEKDIRRQKEIEEFLKCEFIRIKH